MAEKIAHFEISVPLLATREIYLVGQGVNILIIRLIDYLIMGQF